MGWWLGSFFHGCVYGLMMGVFVWLVMSLGFFFYQGYILDFGFCMVFSLEFFASKYACVGVVVDIR